jgi:hypothetical protein
LQGKQASKKHVAAVLKTHAALIKVKVSAIDLEERIKRLNLLAASEGREALR